MFSPGVWLLSSVSHDGERVVTQALCRDTVLQWKESRVQEGPEFLGLSCAVRFPELWSGGWEEIAVAL